VHLDCVLNIEIPSAHRLAESTLLYRFSNVLSEQQSLNGTEVSTPATCPQWFSILVDYTQMEI